MSSGLRVLVVGTDPSVWVAISTHLNPSSSRVVIPEDLEVGLLRSPWRASDVVVVVTNSKDPDPCRPLRELRKVDLHHRAVVLADQADSRTAAEALQIGVGAYLTRGASPEWVSAVIARVAQGGAFYEAPAAEFLRNSISGAHTPSMGAARALASALEFKDTYTGGHAERVTALAMRLADFSMLSEVIQRDALEAAFLLHDVGKIGIPESILNKTGALTDTERRVLETHPILGERIVGPLGFHECVRDVVRFHHERWDGNGYPDGLRGVEIPAAARVFAIADVIDAMTSIRPYRTPVPFDEALAEIKRHSGTQFDPTLAAFIEDVYADAPSEIVLGPLGPSLD